MRNFGGTKLWCHMSLDTGERFTNKNIRESKPVRIVTFRELVPAVARISNHNPDYTLFFRGQSNDYKLSSGASSFYPTIFRKPGASLSTKELDGRYQALDNCSKELVHQLESLSIENVSKIRKFPELQWSILQHYEVCGTPLLDVTHSLRVAASFALNGASNFSYIFIYAFPYSNGTISYSTEEELLNVRLLSACPSEALRPHFQEGFLVGTFPSRVRRKQPSLDFGRRLVAKIEIPKKGFWGKAFHAIPKKALYPDGDEMESLCSIIKAGYGT